MRIIVVGGGKAGSFLLGALSRSHDVVLLEKDPARVELLRERFPGAHVRHGDGCEPTVLEQAGIGDCDLVVAVTGDDEDNLVISYLAKFEFGVPLVFAKVNNPRNEWLFNSSWGVDVAVDTAGILASLVEEEVGLGELVTLLKLQRENIALEEFTVDEGSALAGRKVGELKWPAQVVLAAVVREGRPWVPHEEEIFRAGDRLLFICSSDRVDELRALLG
jgi:trk system potassium uptake protein TrkA